MHLKSFEFHLYVSTFIGVWLYIYIYIEDTCSVFIVSVRTNPKFANWVMGLIPHTMYALPGCCLRWILLTLSSTWSLCIVKDRSYVCKGRPRWWKAEGRSMGFFRGFYTIQGRSWTPIFLDDSQQLDLCVGLNGEQIQYGELRPTR